MHNGSVLNACVPDRLWWRCVVAPLAVLGLWTAFSAGAHADVVVLRNRTDEEIAYRLEVAADVSRSGAITAGEVVTLSCRGPAHLSWGDARDRLWANSAYDFLLSSTGEIRLHELPLGRDPRTGQGTGVANQPLEVPERLTTLPVKILVDQAQRAARQVWEPRLRKRVEAASEVLERQCGVRIEVVAVETWESSERLRQFGAAVRQFHQSVDPAPGRIAIGFTSQYREPDGRFHLGATRGAFFSHVLIREWTQHVSESERLEVLVHELGHVLGAAHSSDTSSVMRPVLGDRQARLRSFQIQFDPANTLAMNLIAEEMAHRNVFSVADLTPATRLRLSQIYTSLDRTLPRDPAAKRVLRRTLGTQAVQTRRVLQAMVAQSQQGKQLPATDAMTDNYVRAAAAAAARLPKPEGRNAFLLALGIGFDTSGVLRRNPATATFVKEVETDQAWRTRITSLGKPTFHGRHDLCQHFAISAYLTASSGRRVAEWAGLGKELIDTTRRSGFSFCDLAADEAGATFARAVARGSLELPMLAAEFRTGDFMPQVDHLPEQLTWQDLIRDYGSFSDDRFLRVREEIRESIKALPHYSRLLSAESQ